jgi:molybdopterin-containing oxidoreductase family membrane subunit
VILYSGMSGLVLVYLWTMFERRFNAWSKPAGLAVLVWRFVLTTGTGSIFGFVVARQAYQSALLAPLFILLSFAWGLAVFLLAQAVLYRRHGRKLPDEAMRRMARLLGVFVAAALFLVTVYHLTNLYYARQGAFEAFILRDGGLYPWLFWGGYVLVGSVAPMALLFQPKLGGERGALTASALVVAGAFAWLFVFIIGGQAFPLEIFPGHVVSSSFADGQVAAYAPALPELLLGLGGIGAAFLLTLVGVHVIDFMPQDELAHGKPSA